MSCLSLELDLQLMGWIKSGLWNISRQSWQRHDSMSHFNDEKQTNKKSLINSWYWIERRPVKKRLKVTIWIISWRPVTYCKASQLCIMQLHQYGPNIYFYAEMYSCLSKISHAGFEPCCIINECKKWSLLMSKVLCIVNASVKRKTSLPRSSEAF